MVKQLLVIIIVVLLLGLGYLYFSLQQVQVEIVSVKFIGVTKKGLGFSFYKPKIKLGLRISNPTFLTSTFTVSNVRIYIEGDLIAKQTGSTSATLKAYGESIVYITLVITDIGALSNHLMHAWIFGQQRTIIVKADITPSLLPVPIPVEASRKL